jgi:hypothetical protein
MSKYLDRFHCARISTKPAVYKHMPKQWYEFKDRRLPWFCISQKMRDLETRTLMKELNLTADDLEDFKMPKPVYPKAGEVVFSVKDGKVPACYTDKGPRPRWKWYDHDLFKLV